MRLAKFHGDLDSRPAWGISFGWDMHSVYDGPKAELSPDQFDQLHDRFVEIGTVFDAAKSEEL